MRYVWKFLSLISGLFLLLIGIPMGFIFHIHAWLCRKSNPDLKIISDNADKTQEISNAVVEIMNKLHPELVNDAKKSVSSIAQKNTLPPAWEKETPSSPIVNPIIPRILNTPPN